MKKNFDEIKRLLDTRVFVITWVALLILALPIIIFPEQSSKIVGGANKFVLTYLGAPYLWFGIFCLIFCLYICFGRYGKVRLGEENEKPEFNMFSWAAMLFCCGVGAGVVYWGFIEWAYYYSAPPLGYAFGSWQAAELSSAYGFFHWGPSAWAIYAVSACAFGYMLFVRKGDILKASEGCRGVLGKYTDGIFGRLIDIFFIFGIVGAVATSLGLATPLVSACAADIFNVPVTRTLDVIILLIIVMMFGFSAFSGLKKGIKVLSDTNVWIALSLVVFVFCVGDTKFIMDTTTSALGLMFQNFFRMSTWTDSVGQSGFPQGWTIFYWAWWAGYAPFLGMFIARISKGRTVKQMVLGSIIFGSLGCILFFGVLGNYGMKLQISGQLDVVASLASNGAPATIVAILETLPFGKVAITLVGLLCIFFAATSYDSASYIIAANTQKKIENGESMRWLRLLWAFGLCLIPVGFIMLDAPLSTLQTATLVLSIPVVIVVILAGFSYINMVKQDIKSKKLNQSFVEHEFLDVINSYAE